MPELAISDVGVVTATRARLGGVGVWLGAINGATIHDARLAVVRIEQAGYGSLWTGEILGGREAFSLMGVLLAASDDIVLGTGIANIWSRHPAAAQGGAQTLGEAYPGRFILGLGISHAAIVDPSGQTWERPMAHTRSYLAQMDAAAANASPLAQPVPRVLAALRPKMMELAREQTDGAHPYFVPPAHTPIARAALGPDRLLIPEQAVVLQTDPSEARRVARRHMSGYLRLPNYVNNLLHMGYQDEDVADGGSDRLVDAIVAWGDESAIAARISELHAGGADHVVIQPLAVDLPAALHQLDELASAVAVN